MSRLSMNARSPSSITLRTFTSSRRSARRRVSNASCRRRLPSWYRPAMRASLYRGGMPTPPRSVKIPENERGGWSSERPRRPGEPERPPRPPDVSARGRVLAPRDRLRYAPGSLLLIVGVDPIAREAFAARVLEEQGALLSMPKLRKMLEGRVPEAEVDDKA